jgi:hypothetical protein
MIGKVAGLAAFVMEPLRQGLWRGGRFALLVLASLVCLSVALGFAASAASSWLGAIYGPTVAALVLAACFLFLATVAFALAMRLRSSRRRHAAAQGRLDGIGASWSAPSEEPRDTIGKSIDLVSLLAATTAKSGLKPLALVSLAMLTGFLIGSGTGKK